MNKCLLYDTQNIQKYIKNEIKPYTIQRLAISIIVCRYMFSVHKITFISQSWEYAWIEFVNFLHWNRNYIHNVFSCRLPKWY